MSNKSVIFSVLIALALGGLLLFVKQRSGQSPAAAQASDGVPLSFDAGQVSLLRLRTADGREDSVTRQDNGGWVYGAGAVQWPAEPTGPQRAAQALCNLRSSGEPKGAAGSP